MAVLTTRKPTHQEILQRWWETKYSLPSNHELFTSRSIFDLTVEYLADHYIKNPLEAQRNEDGEIQFKDTGDSLIDKWEEQIASGEDVDLTEAFSADALDKLTSRLRKRSDEYEDYSFGSMMEKVERIEKHDASLKEAAYKKRISTFGE